MLAVGQPVQGLPAGVYRALDRVLDVYPPWPIPRIGAARLGRLGFDDRPGKENLAGLAHLRDLAIWLWRDTDFRFLRSAQELVTLHVEGTKQVGSLERLQACEALVDLEIIDMCPASLEPLGHLTQLDAVTRLARVQRIGRPSAEWVWLIGK